MAYSEYHGVINSNDLDLVSKRSHLFNKDELSRLTSTPIKAMNFTTRSMLEKRLTGRDKYVERVDCKGVRVINNIKGVAELSGIRSGELGTPDFKFSDILEEMGDKRMHFLDLINILICIKRGDVLKECSGNLLNDCRLYAETQERRAKMFALNASECDDDYSTNTPFENRKWLFDAFICSAQDDLQLALVLVEALEQRKFRIYFPERDLLPGNPIHAVNAFFIEERCKHVIVILTDGFSKSPECSFQLKFSSTLDPAARTKKIIPVKFDANAPVPRTLNHIRCITLCDMETNEWSKLFNALKYEHRINRNVLENITYPQHHMTGIRQNNSFESDVAPCDESQTERNQPDGQEPSLNEANKSEDAVTSPNRPTPQRSRSCPVETTV